MSNVVKEYVSKLFERCYNRMTTDFGRNVALTIYYVTRTVIVIWSVTVGYGAVKWYLP